MTSSVKVAVRVRPFNERELSLSSKCIIRMEGNKTIVCHANESQQQPNKEFIYDASYWSFSKTDPHFASQTTVFNDLGIDTIKNAFDGYNACVCAYGQTGSGKSYSMMGGGSTSVQQTLQQEDDEQQSSGIIMVEEDEGLIPRIAKNLFKRIEANSSGSTTTNSCNYRTEVSYLEIYNEKVRDLLRTAPKKGPKEQQQQMLKVREHPKTGVYVQDLSQHTVVNYDDIRELISRGNLNRTTAATNMNDVSSRSHAIFTIKFAQAKIVDQMPSETVSKINLVDLAGSERADSSGATGLRLKEGCNINRSLLTFINVISTLADLATTNAAQSPSGTTKQQQQQQQQYIPYRDSVLTWLLKDSLGGNSKTVILAAISPADLNYAETLSTLRYANRAKNIMNKPTVNEDPNVKLIRELKAEITKLKSMLMESSTSGSLVNGEARFLDDCLPEDKLKSNGGGVDLNSDEERKRFISASDRKDSDMIMKKIDLNQSKIEKLTNKWKCKWQNFHSIFDEYENFSIVRKNKNSGISLHWSNEPYLISIEQHRNQLHEQQQQQTQACTPTDADDDVSSKQNSLNIYPLKEGKTMLNGTTINSMENSISTDLTSMDDSVTEIDLNDATVSKTHCCLHKLGTKVYIQPINGAIQVNNRLYEPGVGQIELNSGDFLVVGDFYLFQYQNPVVVGKIETGFGKIDTNLSHINLVKLFKMLLLDAGDVDRSERDRVLHEKLAKYETQLEEQREQLSKANEQIEMNNQEMNRLKEASMTKNVNHLGMNRVGSEENGFEEEDEEGQMQEIVEQFERDEKLLSECLKTLGNNKHLESQLKTYLFELQSCRLREHELEHELKSSRREFDVQMETLHKKRDVKLCELNRTREQVMRNPHLIDLKNRITELNRSEIELVDALDQVKMNLSAEWERMVDMDQKLATKRAYAHLDDNNNKSWASLIAAENETIRRSKQLLEESRASKLANQTRIESQCNELVQREADLVGLLTADLCHTDEEKSAVEIELKETRAQLACEKQALDDLKRLDQEELSKDEERLQLMYESSIEGLERSIRTVKERVNEKREEQRVLDLRLDEQTRRMNEMLIELEQAENRRRIDENKIFQNELQVAGEIKQELERLNKEVRKCEQTYKKKIDEVFAKREALKPKIFSLVGNKRGSQLYEADFSPKIPVTNTNSNDSLSSPKRLNISQTYTDLNRSTQFVVDISSPNNNSNNDETTSNHSNSPQHYAHTFKIQTYLCNRLGVSLEINKSHQLGKRFRDEHWEYEIELKLTGSGDSDEQWSIFRRYSKIRELHERMSATYPSLTRIVFPMKWMFNSSERNITARQMQLENYLKLFLEVMLNDPTSPIFALSNQLTTSHSMNSIVLNSPITQQFVEQNRLTKAKLCAFSPFFEQTTTDLEYLEKLRNSSTMKKSRSSSITMSSLDD